MLRFTIQQRGGSWPTSVTFTTHSDGTSGLNHTIDFANGIVTQHRSGVGQQISSSSSWTSDAVLSFTPGTSFTITAIVDRTSAEIFVGDGQGSLTCLLFPNTNQLQKAISAIGGAVLISAVEIRI